MFRKGELGSAKIAPVISEGGRSEVASTAARTRLADSSRPPRQGAALAVVVAVVTLSGVWAASLQGCDEAYYAQMARAMLETGDWVVPRYDGVAPLDKPPLLMWLVAASFRAFGVGDLQARLPALAVGAALPFALWAGLPGAPEFRFTAAATLATLLLYVQLQHAVMTDLLAFAGLVAFALSLLRAGQGGRWGWLAGLGLGVAALAKGALVALLVVASLPYTVLHRKEVLQAGFLLRVLPGLSPALAWYAYMWQEFGWRFTEVHFGVFLVRLATQGIASDSPLGPAFYLASALWRFLPWWPLLPAAVAAGWSHARSGDRAARWSVGFLAVYFLGITAMRTKADHYALPLALPVALLVATWATADAREGRPDRWSAAACLGFGGVLGVAGVLVAAGLVPAPVEGRLPAAALAALLAGALVCCGRNVYRGGRSRAWRSLLWPVVLTYAVGGALLQPWDAEPGLRAVVSRLPHGEPVVYVTSQPPDADFCPYSALRFQLDRPPQVLSPKRFALAPAGWYVGRRGDLVPTARDRVVVEQAGWVLVRRR